MDSQTYNQYSVALSVVGDVIKYFKEGENMFIYVHEDEPLSVRPPNVVRLEVTQTEDAARGDTVSNAKKEAELETGVTVMVPLFIKKGDTIAVNPETGEYTGRE